MRPFGGWEPEPDSVSTPGMIRKDAAADAASLIVGTTLFLRDVAVMQLADRESFDMEWRVSREA